MDTRFWGPSGWKLLHLLTFSTKQDRKLLCSFFNTLPYVLPCKFCRYSLSEYIQEDPIENVCDSPLSLQKWLWRIHNRVNEKLRAQGLQTNDHPYVDPPFSSVAKIYKEKIDSGCSKTVFDGWDFLFSIADNHPLSTSSKNSTAIQDAPPIGELKTALSRNRWNVMEPEERMVYYRKFWQLVPKVLPFQEWRTLWIENEREEAWETQKRAVGSLWKIRCEMEKGLELLNKTDYSSLCKLLQSQRSGCSKTTRSKTCRKKRNNK